MLNAAWLALAIGPGLVAPQAPVKRALLIGVSDYSKTEGKWQALASDRDVAAIGAALREFFAFQPGDIRTLEKQSETTRQAILEAIESWLVAPAKPGDIIYLHYSGHGYQTEDDNADEADFLDEVLVPSDGTSAKQYIRDDEIEAALRRLRDKGVKNVTVTFDCCNSGSNTRGIEKTRGRAYPAFGEVRVNTSRGTPVPGTLLQGTESRGYVVLQAAAPHESARETEGGGRFSVALVEAWRKAATSGRKLTYRALYETIAESMARLYRVNPQQPQMEGDADRYLFDLAAVRSAPYFPVRVEDEAVLLMAGEVHGITPGTKVALFPSSAVTFGSDQALATATVTAVDVSTAELALPPDFDREKLVAGRAVVTEFAVNAGALRLFIDDDAAPLRSDLAGMTSVDLAGARATDYDLKVTRSATGYTIEQRDGVSVASIPADGEAGERLRAALASYVRWSLIRRLDNPISSSFTAEIRIVRVETEADPQNRSFQRFKAAKEGAETRQLKPGDVYGVQIRVQGDLNPHIAVIDLLPDGTVNQLWPLNARDQKVPTLGDWYWLSPGYGFVRVGDEKPGSRIDLYGVDPSEGGLGTEALKLMVTKDFVDFSGLMSGAATARGGNPLEELLSAYGTGTRSKSQAAPPKDWATATVTFQVVAG